MAVFKRIELWVLLALTVAGTWYVLRQPETNLHETPVSTSNPESDSHSLEDSETSASPHLFSEVLLTADGDHFILEIAAVFRNTSSEPLEISAESARLIAPDGRQIPAFLTPIDAGPTALAAQAEQRLVLRYWATPEALESPLTLHLGDDRLPIKTLPGFDSALAREAGPLRFRDAGWSKPG